MLYLPDTMAHLPGEKVINPHHKEVEAEFDAQFSKFMPHVIELGLAETMRKWDTGTCKSCPVFHVTDQMSSSAGCLWSSQCLERLVVCSCFRKS